MARFCPVDGPMSSLVVIVIVYTKLSVNEGSRASWDRTRVADWP